MKSRTAQLPLVLGATAADPFPELRGAPPNLLTGDDATTEGDASSWAVFSIDRVYRYLLGRCWHPGKPWLVVGMLNPSKADADKLDPTLTRVRGFAVRDGFGGMIVWNSCALVSTDPKGLLRHPDPVGPHNPEAIRAACRLTPSVIVVGWGKPANRRVERCIARARVSIVAANGVWRWGETTLDGHPRHPLYLRADTPLVKHSGSGGAA